MIDRRDSQELVMERIFVIWIWPLPGCAVNKAKPLSASGLAETFLTAFSSPDSTPEYKVLPLLYYDGQTFCINGV